MLMRQLAGCFTTWSLLVTEKIRLRNVCRRIMKRMLQRSLHNCYQQWSHNAQEQIMMRMFESKVVTKLRRRRLKYYYTTWHSTSLQQIKERSKTVRLDRILMQLRLKKKFTVLKHLFVVWRDRFVNVQKHQHRLKRNLLSRRHLCLVRCALRQWWRTARDQIHFNVTMQRFVYTIKSKLMKSYVFQWKMKTRSIRTRAKFQQLKQTMVQMKDEKETNYKQYMHYKEQTMLKEGHILELTVTKRQLLATMNEHQKMHETKQIKARNVGIAETKNMFRKTELEFLKKGRIWSAERNRLKLELETISSRVMAVETEKLRLLRDLNVTKATSERMQETSKKYKKLANKIQRHYDDSIDEKKNNGVVMERQFYAWRAASKAKEEKLQQRYHAMHQSYQSLTASHQQVLTASIPALHLKLVHSVRKYKNHLLLSKMINHWHSIVLSQRVGARIALRSTQSYQRRALRDQKCREVAEQNYKQLFENMNEKNKLMVHLKEKLLLLEARDTDRLQQVHDYKKETHGMNMEIQMLEHEMTGLRDKCIEFDACQLTASVLEKECGRLRDDLEMIKNEEAQGWNSVRLELENLVDSGGGGGGGGGGGNIRGSLSSTEK